LIFMESAGIAHRTPSPPVGTPSAPERPRRPRDVEPAPTQDAAPIERGLLGTARDYFALTKPRIITLLLWTTVMTMIVAKPSGLALSTVLWTCLGGYLASGGAGAINHYLDRKLDARMARTATRPLVEGRIEPLHGLYFGIALGLLAFVQLTVTVNLLAAALAMGGLLGYVFIYTAWLKPRTPQNIVIGGAAGAMPPLVGWAAATGSLTLEALYPFAIIFLWTPPHFWALSLMIREDYERTGVPMLPVIKGEAFTRRQIVLYAAILVAFTVLPCDTGMLGAFYLASAVALGGVFLGLAVILFRNPSKKAALRLYLSSLAYLALLFGAMAIDRLIAI
jgi:protoheme IX farnesyltransferase